MVNAIKITSFHFWSLWLGSEHDNIVQSMVQIMKMFIRYVSNENSTLPYSTNEVRLSISSKFKFKIPNLLLFNFLRKFKIKFEKNRIEKVTFCLLFTFCEYFRGWIESTESLHVSYWALQPIVYPQSKKKKNCHTNAICFCLLSNHDEWISKKKN